ncbi:carbonic anhydrase [uncultured Desulfovibrio sp.]|uniref:carbonic anhydrase n=1 Tax=Candidatus Desulfovibrio intestinavium TaxID=2838534 RepID=A0A9D2HP17_9BACT|nr:carbonic anhydrase [uncultured Desulfovibrio sp.]HJA79570.1 carbonic anhydrase [Candidatus Desulfovibrio intestinavium]
MRDFHKFIDGFKNFRQFYYDAEVNYYEALRDGQHPKALVIACSDSRADPALLMGCDPGDIFVVRNVANLVPHAEEVGRGDAVLAVLEYGVRHLKVEHVIVLGHSCCGGIHALLHPEGTPPDSHVAQWVGIARPAIERLGHSEADPAARRRDCEEAAVLLSVENLLSYPWIRRRVAEHRLSLHAWYFDMEAGDLLAYFPDSEQFESLHEHGLHRDLACLGAHLQRAVEIG